MVEDRAPIVRLLLQYCESRCLSCLEHNFQLALTLPSVAILKVLLEVGMIPPTETWLRSYYRSDTRTTRKNVLRCLRYLEQQCRVGYLQDIYGRPITDIDGYPITDGNLQKVLLDAKLRCFGDGGFYTIHIYIQVAVTRHYGPCTSTR